MKILSFQGGPLAAMQGAARAAAVEWLAQHAGWL
jgi:hypothetical protein